MQKVCTEHYKSVICELESGVKQRRQHMGIKGHLLKNGSPSGKPDMPGNMRKAVLSRAFSSLRKLPLLAIAARIMVLMFQKRFLGTGIHINHYSFCSKEQKPN